MIMLMARGRPHRLEASALMGKGCHVLVNAFRAEHNGMCRQMEGEVDIN